MSDKVIITAALTGAVTRKEQNPAVPYTPEEFAEDAYKVYNSGGSDRSRPRTRSRERGSHP